MASRNFEDANGVRWTVWEVIPHGLGSTGVRVRPEFAAGWLAFQTGDERRRLTPIPEGWEHCTDAQLARMCARARPTPRTPLI